MSDDEPVLIAGAGPVGMSAALALRARGVDVEILEADPEDRDRPGSRANYVHGATLRILEAVHPGLGERIADEGVVWPTRRTYWRGREVFSRTYDDPGGSGALPPFTSIPQVTVEDYLLDALRERDVPIHWATPVVDVTTADDGVVVEDADGGSSTAPFVIGADGAESAVRDAIGVEFEGDRSANSFVIADVAELDEDPRPLERVYHYGHPGADGRNVLLVPFTDGWRVDITCRPGDDPDRMQRDEILSGLVARTLGERYADRVEWVSRYRFLQVTADRFVDEHARVLLCGEAAHLFAPFGARGMNSGIHDADAAASALCAAVHAETRDAARTEVENYAALREAAAEWNKYAAGEALDHIQGRRLGTRVKKHVAAQAARVWSPAGRWLDEAPFGPLSSPPIPTRGKY